MDQENKIDELTFILEQEELRDEFLSYLKRKNKVKSQETAAKWLREYENEILFENNEKEALAYER